MAEVADTLKEFEGRSIVVVGASGALGSAVAMDLAERGASVTMSGANGEKLGELEEELARLGIASCVVQLRPDSEHQATEIIAKAVKKFGHVDGLVMASGTYRVAKITEMTTEQFDEVMSANVRSTWLICRAFGSQLLQSGSSGSVVLVSSIRGLLGEANYSVFSTSKGAVNLLTRTLAAEWGASNIRVNAVAPGMFRNDRTAWMYGEDPKAIATRQGILSRIPLGRLAEPDDVVGPVTFFLSDKASFCTGQILYVDGGYTAC